MKVVCISDLHSQLNFSIPKCDLLLIAGDLCPAYHSWLLSIGLQSHWLSTEFRYWLVDQPCKEAIYVSGNHDWIFEKAKHEVPKKMNANLYYLEDNSIEVMGLKIYGSPWQLLFNDWAFNKPEKELEKIWGNIPDDIDILLIHSNPYNIGDKNFSGFNIGSKSLKKRIFEIISKPNSKLKLVVSGHNHIQSINEYEGVRFINASLINDDYKMVYKPVLVEI